MHYDDDGIEIMQIITKAMIIVIVMIVSATIGGFTERKRLYDEAFKNGVGEYVVDPSTGASEWQWKPRSVTPKAEKETMTDE